MSAPAGSPRSVWTRGFVGWASRAYRERLTLHGRILLFGLFASAMLGFTYDTPIYYIGCGVGGFFLAAAMAGAFFRPDIQARRALPLHVCAGERINYEVRLQNQSRRPARAIEVRELNLPAGLVAVAPESAGVSVIPGRGEDTVALGLECRKRGVYQLPSLAPASSFPSGLFRAFRRGEGGEQLLVYPSFQRLSDFALPGGRRYQPGGLALTSSVGDSTEFQCTREYRYGDSVRLIHWASFARTGKPVVKEFQEEYFVRLAMLLDSEVTGSDDRAFETGISFAASVADALSRKEYIIDIFAAGESIYRFQAGRALAHFDNILEILACITHAPSVDLAAVDQALRSEAGRLSALICVLMDWDEKRKAMIQSLQALGLATKTVVVRETPPTLPLAGERDVTWYRPDQVLEAFT